MALPLMAAITLRGSGWSSYLSALDDLLALRRPGQRWWRRCAPFTWALSVVAAALQLATIPIPNVLEVAWLLLYEARGTCPHLCFRTH